MSQETQHGSPIRDFIKGFITGGGLIGIACFIIPWIPFKAIEMHKQNKVDKEYSTKLKELNHAILELKDLKIKVPKEWFNEDQWKFWKGEDLLDDLLFIARITLYDRITHTEEDKHTETSKQVYDAHNALQSDIISILQDVTKCAYKIDSDASYDCKQDVLDSIDNTINTIKKDNSNLHKALANLAEACSGNRETVEVPLSTGKFAKISNDIKK